MAAPTTLADVTVTVEVQEPAPQPPAAAPPDLAETGAPLVVLLGLGVALTAAGLCIRRLADRSSRGGTT